MLDVAFFPFFSAVPSNPTTVRVASDKAAPGSNIRPPTEATGTRKPISILDQVNQRAGVDPESFPATTGKQNLLLDAIARSKPKVCSDPPAGSFCIKDRKEPTEAASFETEPESEPETDPGFDPDGALEIHDKAFEATLKVEADKKEEMIQNQSLMIRKLEDEVDDLRSSTEWLIRSSMQRQKNKKLVEKRAAQSAATLKELKDGMAWNFEVPAVEAKPPTVHTKLMEPEAQQEVRQAASAICKAGSVLAAEIVTKEESADDDDDDAEVGEQLVTVETRDEADEEEDAVEECDIFTVEVDCERDHDEDTYVHVRREQVVESAESIEPTADMETVANTEEPLETVVETTGTSVEAEAEDQTVAPIVQVQSSSIQRLRNFPIVLGNHSAKYSGPVAGCPTTPGRLVAHGIGIARFSSGEVYAGSFEYGKMQGTGAIYPSPALGGDKISGNFFNNELCKV